METTKYIDIFAAGVQTDAGGHTSTWTRQDLDRLVNTFDEAERRVPLVIGHPQTDDPAYGWVQTLRRAGDKLQACFRQVPEAIKNTVKQGRYKNISICVGRDGKLRHVGLLGAAQPAVPGLAPVEFGDAGDGATYYMEKKNVNEEQLKAKIAELEAKVAELEKRLAETQTNKEKAESEFAEYRAEQTKKMRVARVDQLVKDGKILPAERARHLSFAEALGAAGTDMDFAEADGSTAKIPAEEAYWRGLEQLPENHHGLFGEFATDERAAAEPMDKPLDLTDINKHA